MLLLSSSSRIFALRSFSSCHLFSLLFDVSILHLALEVYTEFGMVSQKINWNLTFPRIYIQFLFEYSIKEPLNNKPCILVKHAIQAFFQNTGLIFTQICLFSLISCFLFCKRADSPLIYVVESFRPAIASEYKLAQANRAYKRFSFFFNPR